MNRIHPTALIHPAATLENCTVGPFCVVGTSDGLLHLENATVRSHTIIEGGSDIGPELETGHHVLIRTGNRIGENLRIGSYSSLEGGAKIGDFVRIHGRCEATNVVMEDFVRVFLNASITDDRRPPSKKHEPPVLKAGCVLCADVLVLAGVTVGEGAYVAGRSVVHKDVRPASVWGRDGQTWKTVLDVGFWPDGYADTYPARAQGRIAALAQRVRARASAERTGEL